jgi:hypothetical protein
MPDPDPPVSPEEELTMEQLADAYAKAAVALIMLPWTILQLFPQAYQGPPERWPFRAGRMPEDDRV